MQCQLIGGVTEDAEVEQSLSGMGRLEKLVLGIDYCGVSLRWYNIVVTNCTCALVQGM